MKTCYIYTRTATVSPQEMISGRSEAINLQIKACKKYAKRHNYKVIQTFEDIGASGANLKRKGLQHLLTACKKELVDAVIVFRIDRLARKVSNFVKINKKLKEKEIKLISVVEGDLSIQNFIANIFIAIAQWELERDEQE